MVKQDLILEGEEQTDVVHTGYTYSEERKFANTGINVFF